MIKKLHKNYLNSKMLLCCLYLYLEEARMDLDCSPAANQSYMMSLFLEFKALIVDIKKNDKFE